MPPPSSTYSQTLYTTVTPILGALAIILNTVELACILKIQKLQRTRKRRSNNYTYIKSLCVSDIMVGFVMVVLKSLDPFMKTTLKGNKIAKESYGVLKFVFVRFSMFISIASLLALTFDRFTAVCRPLKHRVRNKWFPVKIVALTWLFSMVCVVVVYCVFRFKMGDVEKYMNMVFPVASYTATVVFLVCYISIYKVVRQGHAGSIINKPKSKGTKQKKCPAIKQEEKLFRLAIIIVCAFCGCWLPHATCSLLKVVGCTCGGKDIDRTLFVLAFSNSILDPFIYFPHIYKTMRTLLSQRVAQSENTGSESRDMQPA